MKKSLITFCSTVLFATTISLPVASANSSATENIQDSKNLQESTINFETPETYKIDVYSDTPNSEGIFELIGSKQVTSNTQIEQVGDDGIYTLHILEDFYNLDGEYVNTKVSYEKLINDYTTGEADGKVIEEELSKPINVSPKMRLTNTQTNSDQIKKLVEDLLPNENSDTYEDVDGISYEEMELEEDELSIQPFATISRGAFDNYYDKTDDNFTAQVLGASANSYIKMKGKYSKNTSGFDKFKGYINTYESNVIDSMNYGANAAAVGKWIGKIGSFVQITASGAAIFAGPVGWASALTVLSRAAMLTKFSGWTLQAYATYARMDFSINAAKAQKNASSLTTTKYFPDVTWTFPNFYH